MDTNRNMAVLLIEDDEIDAENVRRFMPRGSNLKHATTLYGALELIDGSSLDLIMLDPGLPDCSGVDTFRRIRESAPKVPVVILTGLHDKQLALNIIREGAQDYLLKNQLDERALQAIHFAVERGRMLFRLEEEQAEQERLTMELREQEKSLAHLGRVALMGEVVAEITHEVSQPLNVISTLAGALKKSLEQSHADSSMNLELVRKLSDANGHAGQILSRLRDFIRDESTTFEPFDINNLIVATTDFVDYERRRRKIEIQHDFAQEELWVIGNKTQVQQVVVNLLRNAFEAMTCASEPERTVTVGTYPHDGVGRIEVGDQGSGMQLDMAEAFSPFTTTKDNGLGMGLAICARIIQNHHGRISVVESEQPGTIFRFELPSAQDHEP